MTFPTNDIPQIITANSRLALHLQSKFDREQQEKNTSVWMSPLVSPLSTWLEKTFYEHNQEGLILLSDFEASCLWADILRRTKQPLPFNPAHLAKLAKEAYERLCLWQLPIEALHSYQQQFEVSQLIEWIALFETALKKHGFTISAHLPAILAKQPGLNLTAYQLAGFDDLPPALHALFENTPNTTPVFFAHPTQAVHYRLPNQTAELRAMALWAKKQYVENPSLKIGCIIPSLNKIRHDVENIFTNVFCMDHIIPGKPACFVPFNISAGNALSSYAAIKSGLALLQWLKKPLRIEEVSSLLQADALCADEIVKCKRAQIDVRLREKNYVQVSFKKIIDHIPEWETLHTQYQTLKQEKHPPSIWQTHFTALLKLANWPTQKTQSSESYQLLERFKKTLQAFARLDILYNSISYNKALGLLTTLCHDTVFQPKSHQEPIQIMGALEASDIHFDAAWIMGMDDTAWPAPASPHPLLPYALQKKYNMPHATAARELYFCKQMTERFKHCAENVVFSSSETEGDQIRNASPLMDDISIDICDIDHATPKKDFSDVAFEIQDDFNVPSILQTTLINGGSKALELQSLCPFRAFATIRLKATPLKKPAIGISYMLKGTLLHETLCILWLTLKDQKTLLSLDEKALQTTIADAIEAACTKLKLTTHYFMALEKERLMSITMQWLAYEKMRPPFEVIACESEETLTLENFTIKTRQDRVDVLSNGQRVLIDYKTNTQRTQGWFEERITNTQLPLYASFHREHYDAVCFAEITPQTMKLKGIASEGYDYGDVDRINQKKNLMGIDNWEALLESWKTRLSSLANDFCRGVATVDPIHPSTCLTCDLQSICRYPGKST